MNEKLRDFLDKKRLERIEKSEEEKRSLLMKLDLVEKVYSPDNSSGSEYPCWEVINNTEDDGNEGSVVYYKLVPIEITDEEYEELKKTVNIEDNKSKNKVASIFKTVAWCVFIVGFIAGIFLAINAYGDFSLIAAIIYWVVAFISGMFFYGFGEIINLLDCIKNK